MTKVYLGTESYPLIDITEKGQLGARAGYMPIELDVNVTPPAGVDLNDYIYGMYVRNLSTRSMLSSINSEFDRRNQLNDKSLKTYASGFLGAPGTGKTFFFNNIGKMSHDRGAILVDCSDKDLKTLFENPTFDSKSANREKAAIDAKIVMRNRGMKEDGLSDSSLEKLRSVMGSALIEDENGHITADWSGIAFEGNDLAEQEHSVQVFQSMLREICKAEGIEISKESSEVGIVMQDGELFRVFDPQSPDYGRPVILDELNRARFGTMDNLYGLLNFLNSPNMGTFTVRGANGKELVIDKNNMPSTFFLNFTGNQAVDGMGSQSFNDPFLSRVPEGFSLRTIPDTTAKDISDMISSYLLGVPGTILFDAFSVDGKSQRSVQDFIEFLKTARTIGLTKKEINEIPQWQMYNINNAGKIIALSRQLGRFFYEVKSLAQRRAPYDKITTGRGDELMLEPGYEAFLATKNVDFRIIPRFFIEADILKGEVMSVGLPKLGASKGSSANTVSEKERYATRGNRLENVMSEWLENTFVPQDMGVRKIEEKTAKAMLEKAMQIARQNGVLPASNKESKSNQTRIADLYNIEVTETGSYYKRLQTSIANVLREKYPEIAHEKDEKILPLSVVSATIQMLTDDGSSPLKTAYKAKNLLILNEDIDEVSQQMFQPAEVVADTNAPTILAENLLMALSLDETKEMNLESIFQIPKGAESSNDFKAYADYGNKQANVKCAFCRVQGQNDKPSYMFLFYNKDTDNLLVVGDNVSSAALKMFTRKNRVYVNRNDVSADELQRRITDVLQEDQVMMVESMLSGYMKWETADNLGNMVAKPSSSYNLGEVKNATVFKPMVLNNRGGR